MHKNRLRFSTLYTMVFVEKGLELCLNINGLSVTPFKQAALNLLFI